MEVRLPHKDMGSLPQEALIAQTAELNLVRGLRRLRASPGFFLALDHKVQILETTRLRRRAIPSIQREVQPVLPLISNDSKLAKR
jgi:hypothetical protein